MKIALLNLAVAEIRAHGHVSEHTRRSLRQYGVDSVTLEQYINLVGA